MSRLALALALVVAVTAGCKHHEEAAKQEGADLAAKRITQPIDQTRAAVGAAEDATAPALLDASANVYHKPNCPHADPGMETTTVAAAKDRGAKPAPDCHPAAN